jgi:hypothetical protein
VAVGHTVADLDIHRDLLGAGAAGHTDLVEVAVGHSLAEVHQVDQEERRNLEVAVGHNLAAAVGRSLGVAVGRSLGVAADHSLGVARRTGQGVRRIRQGLGWSSRLLSRSFGQWHQGEA